MPDEYYTPEEQSYLLQEREKAETQAVEDAKLLNQQEGRGPISGLFNADKKPLTPRDALHVQALREDAERELYVGPLVIPVGRDEDSVYRDKQEQSWQREVALHVPWLVATQDARGELISKELLEEVGLTVIGVYNNDSVSPAFFYKVQVPPGWKKSTTNYWTTIQDADGNEVLKQFYKANPNDTSAFISLTKVK